MTKSGVEVVSTPLFLGKIHVLDIFFIKILHKTIFIANFANHTSDTSLLRIFF